MFFICFFFNIVFRSLIMPSNSNNKSISSLSAANNFFNSFSFSLIDFSISSIFLLLYLIFQNIYSLILCTLILHFPLLLIHLFHISFALLYQNLNLLNKFKCIMSLFASISFKAFIILLFIIRVLDIFFYISDLQKYVF